MTEWEECKKQAEIARDFCSKVKPGDTVKLERYAYPEYRPYMCNKHADKRIKEVVTVYAMHPEALWYTDDKCQAVDADTIVKWEFIPKQASLF